MMKKMIMTIAACTAAAQVYAATVGIVNMETLFEQAQLAHTLNAASTELFNKKFDEQSQKEEAFNAEVEAYQKNAEIMSQQARQDTESALMKTQQALQQAQYELNQAVAKRKQDDADQFMSQVQDVVKNIAAQDNLDVVLPSGLSLYFTDSIDVTAQTLEQLNKDKA